MLKEVTIWAGSQPIKSTDVGIPCSEKEPKEIQCKSNLEIPAFLIIKRNSSIFEIMLIMKKGIIMWGQWDRKGNFPSIILVVVTFYLTV